jgi:hypothetical protein
LIKKESLSFWAGDDHYSGAQCLVAWDIVCSSKPVGGLGVKNLHVQNVCLLLKFCFKTLHDPNTPWNISITNLSPCPISHDLNISFLGKNINKHMDTLRSITQCSVNNGKANFFCLDRWILPETLATAFPALFSHHQHHHGLVSDIMHDGVQNATRKRLTTAASSELSSLLSLLQVFQLSDGDDSRTMIGGQPFSTKAAYAALHHSASELQSESVRVAYPTKQN